MDQDLLTLEKIFQTYGYADQYIVVLLDHVLNEMKNRNLKSITPNLLYSSLMFEVGRKRSQEISELFDEYKKTGNFQTPLQKYLSNASWMKK
jgi:hypothetical protein